MLDVVKRFLMRVVAAYGFGEAPLRRRPEPVRILHWSR